MKLIEINKNGTQKYQLKDGRFIYSYNSGYVRIDSNLDRLYQINRVVKIPPRTDGNYFEMNKRVLIHCPQERFEYIKAWVSRNVGDLPYDVVRQLRALEFYKKEYWKR